MNLAYNLNPKFRLLKVDLSDATTVNTGTSNTQTLTPPSGSIYQIIDMHYSCAAPGGAASGTHEIEVTLPYATAKAIILVKSAFGDSISINNYGFYGTTTEYPIAANEQLPTMREWLCCSNSIPLSFTYNNDTDVNKTGTRLLYLLVKIHNESG